MRNAGLDGPAGIEIARGNINNLRYADDTTLMAESGDELKSLLMKVKEESEKVSLKLHIQKANIMSCGPITSWQIDAETVETVADFIFLGSKITADGVFSQEIKRCLLLERKAINNLAAAPHRWQPTRLPRPWDSPGKNTGVGCHFLLQCMKVKNKSELAQLCLTLATPWTAAYKAPPSMGFSRQKYWSGLPLPSLINNLDSKLKKHRRYFANKGPSSPSKLWFSSSHVSM